ncbi:MAG: ribosome-recycling factor [Myxococcales bacterium]
MIKEIIDDTRDSMGKVIENLQRDLTRTRTGRANLSILDGIRVDYYGTSTPLNQVAALTVVDPRMISIKPWDKSLLPIIEKAIISSDLGLNPGSDGELLRLPIPPLTQERRQELAKGVRKQGEDAKIAIRNIRRDAKTLLDDLDGVSEDDVTRAHKSVQDTTDEHVKRVDDVVAKKEKEITEI